METMENLRERLEALENQTRAVKRQLHCWRGVAYGAVVLALLSWALPSGEAQVELSAKGNRGLERRVEALEHKLAHITSGPYDVTITGVNLRIVNGLGDTQTTNGLGNLIVGYNELRNIPNLSPDVRTGSHNVVVGQYHNFSSFGGLAVGAQHEISGEFSTVLGGVSNTASGVGSSVCGGDRNIASGAFASISGGNGNTASGVRSVVSGGELNTASGNFSSVSGGIGNTTSERWASVSGGGGNIASGLGSSVSGGENNTASGDSSSVSGGRSRIAPARDNWAAGSLFADN